MFGTNLICYQHPKAGYETKELHSSFGHADLDKKIMNRKRPILRVPQHFKVSHSFYWISKLCKRCTSILLA
jgi:hypothetical protein